MAAAAIRRFLVLLMLVLAIPAFLVSCASEKEKPLEQAEEEVGLEEAEQLQPQSQNRD